ncbi:MAG: hypothetical protein Q8N17_11725 [Burkholderiaceae bacterium]|nr:hypothetical protein [Burkholderiaceae bacterium]
MNIQHPACGRGVSVVALACVVLWGCSAPRVSGQLARAEASVQEAVQWGAAGLPLSDVPGSATQAQSRAQAQSQPPVARRASRSWVGSRFVSVQSDEQLPPIFSEKFSFNFDDRSTAGRVPIEIVAERISRMTQVPVRLSADVRARLPVPAGGASAATGATGLPPLPARSGPLPAAGPRPPRESSEPAFTTLPTTQLDAIEMKDEGADMASYLNMLADRLGLSWTYREGAVIIHRFVTESFELGAFAATQDYNMSMSGASAGAAGGGSGGPSGNSASQLQVTESGRAEGLPSLLKALNGMLASVPGSSVTLNEASARLSVTTTRDAMRTVRELLRQEQSAMTRQVLIQFDIYTLSANNAHESGVNLSLLFSQLQRGLGITLSTPLSSVSAQAGGAAVSILSVARGGDAGSTLVQRLGDSNLVIQALSQQGLTVQHRPLSMIALNRQWARKTNLRQTGYLSETTASTIAGAGSGAPGLKTSSVTTGDRFMVQPAILDDGSVLLKFGVSLTDLLGLFDVTAGSGATVQKVQTPEVSGTDDQSTVLLRAGQVMMLTGLSRVRAQRDGRSLGESLPQALGGSSRLSTTREDFVIFIRPVLL